MTKTLAKTFKVMPGNARITFPPTIRFFSDIKEGDLVKVWITDDSTIHIKKITECDGCTDIKPIVSVDSIVELLNDMSNEDKVKVIKGITPPCFVGGLADGKE